MDEAQLVTLVIADLHADGFEVTEPPPPPPPTKPPERPSGTQTSQIPDWVERLADVFALIVSAFAIMQAGSWFGKDNFIVAIAMGAAIVFLVANYNGPVRMWLRAIFVELILTIVTLVEAIGKFFEAAGKYYGGNFARMVLALVLVPVALGVFKQFFDYPAVRDLADWLQTFIKQAQELAQRAVRFVEEGLAEARAWTAQQLGELAALLPKEIQRSAERILQDVDQLFARAERRTAALEARVGQQGRDLVAWAGGELDTLHAQLTLFGGRLDLTPELVRRYLAERTARQVESVAADVRLPTFTGPEPPEAVRAALARVTRQIEAAAAGAASPQLEAVRTVEAGIREVAA